MELQLSSLPLINVNGEQVAVKVLGDKAYAHSSRIVPTKSQTQMEILERTGNLDAHV